MESVEPVASNPRRRILVVEDDQEILGTLAGLLEEEGYDVQSVSDGRDALERLRAGPPPELIILDLMMPGMDGWEFRTIQRADPELRSIPVLAISADTSAKAAAIDATSFLRKPFRFTDLLDSVQKIIDERERSRMKARLEEAERLASLGTLAAGAAHEISNPLAFTVANLDTMDDQIARIEAVLERHLGPPELVELRAMVADVRDLLGDAKIGAERVSRVVRNLQSIARRPEEQHQAVNLHEVLESAISLTWNQIRHRARLVRDFTDLPLVEGSKFRLGQLFVNLLVNAAQAIPEGRAQENEIEVIARTRDGRAVLEIRDTGVGISPTTRARLFDPFFTTKPAGTGTGLGLSICQSVVLEHRGTIEVESTPGEGSTFRVSLPGGPRQSVLAAPPAAAAAAAPTELAESAEPATPPAAAAPAPTPVAGVPQRGHVIIVDDEPHLAWAMKRLLDRDHQVVAVTHGQEALDRMLAGERFDVMICDLTMPYMTGEELYREIRGRFGPETASRMLFVTGGPLSPETNSFLQEVPNPRLFKPFDPDELRAQVRQLMGGEASIQA